MKTKKYLLILAVIILLAGCSMRTYPHGKQFKPDHSQVRRCQTYDDVIQR